VSAVESDGTVNQITGAERCESQVVGSRIHSRSMIPIFPIRIKTVVELTIKDVHYRLGVRSF
jgi:hypothetical protein